MCAKRSRKASSWGDIAYAGAVLNPESDYYDADAALEAARQSELGQRKQAIGASFEEIINRQLDALNKAGIAVLHKTGAPTRVTGRQPNGKLNISYTGEEGPCDYIGSAMGYSVAFDAKSTANMNVWSVKKDTPHQHTFMEDTARHCPGAYVGYLIRWSEHDEIRWHPLYGKTYYRVEGMLLPDGELKHIFLGG